MTKFEQAVVPQSDVEQLIVEAVKKWEEGDELFRRFLETGTKEEAEKVFREFFTHNASFPVFVNDTYQVQVRPHEPLIPTWPKMIWLSIKRIDRQTIHDWRELQEIKNQLVGPECEAVELYPAESRLVDTSNQYHLWCIPDPEQPFPFGMEGERCVTDQSFFRSVNRPLPKKDEPIKPA